MRSKYRLRNRAGAVLCVLAATAFISCDRDEHRADDHRHGDEAVAGVPPDHAKDVGSAGEAGHPHGHAEVSGHEGDQPGPEAHGEADDAVDEKSHGHDASGDDHVEDVMHGPPVDVEALHGEADDQVHVHDPGAESRDGHAAASHAGYAHKSDAVLQGTVIEISPAVQENLGITFVKAERRPVRSTVRLPGVFELRPEARRQYNVMLAGRIDVKVKQYERVKAGDELFTLDSAEWRRVQSNLAEAYKTCYCCLPELEVARATKRENEAEINYLEKRIAALTATGSRSAELEGELAVLKMRTPRYQAEVEAKEADRQSALLAYGVLLNEAQTLTGIDRGVLEKRSKIEGEEVEKPQWAREDLIVVRAQTDGVVSEVGVTDGGWAEVGDLVVETIDPHQIRFHADAVQTDIALFENGQAARVVPPQGGSIALEDTVDGVIEMGFEAHPTQRTVSIFMTAETWPRWAKPGMTAYLEVFVEGHDKAVPAIPRAAVVRDGLNMVYFLRDRDNPNRVRRVEAELGASDGRWVEIKSGLKPGDSVVLGGVYPLMLSSSDRGDELQGVHIHGDGTAHAGAEQ